MPNFVRKPLTKNSHLLPNEFLTNIIPYQWLSEVSLQQQMEWDKAFKFLSIKTMQLWRRTGTSQKLQIVLTQCNNSNHSSLVVKKVVRGIT